MRENEMQSLCRLCLGEKGKLIHVLEPCRIPELTAADAIKELLRFQVSVGDIYPQCVCIECLTNLEDFKLFKQQCERNKELLDRASDRKLKDGANEELMEVVVSCDGVECEVSIREDDDAEIPIEKDPIHLNEREIQIKTEPEEISNDSNEISSAEVNESNLHEVFIPVKCEHEDKKTTETEQTIATIRHSSTEATKTNVITGMSSVTVNELQQLKFSKLSHQERLLIKRRGRSTPDIQISQLGTSNNKKYVRSFNSEWYRRKSWLCGCPIRNALFCFPCLLYGGDITWTKDGFKNINRMKEKTEKHERSKKHIDNVVSMTLLDNIDVKDKLSEAHRISIAQHNVKVKKNREILSKIIECTLLSGNFVNPSYGEMDDSSNLWVFGELLTFASQFDTDLKNHLEADSIFKGASGNIQNEILDCLLQIYTEEVANEVREADFVAVMVEDVRDHSEYTELAIVLRYLFNGEIFERFLGFFKPESQTADCITRCIVEQLDIVLQGSGEKLIAQSFDGRSDMNKRNITKEIKAAYGNAHYIHSYSHELNSILGNAVSKTRSARIFFFNLVANLQFFASSPKYSSIFQKHMNSSFQNSPSNSLNLNACTINSVYDNLQSLNNCLSEIQTTSNIGSTVAGATGILAYLKGSDFMFWLELFRQIIPHVEAIYNRMQSRQIGVFEVGECIKDFENAISEIQTSKYCKSSSKTLTIESNEVCECLRVDITNRYSSNHHLAAATLFDKERLSSYRNEPPRKEMALVSEAYPMIDKEKLETELKVFYCRSEMHKYNGLVELLKFICVNNLDGVLSEMTKLIMIVLTIPMYTSEMDRCFPTMTRIRRYLRSAVSAERLNSVAVISLEGNFLANHPEMKEKVLDLFSKSKARGTDFVFR